VEGLDVAEDREPGLIAACPAAALISSFLIVEMKLSQAALS
jgi:hypothetical protein